MNTISKTPTDMSDDRMARQWAGLLNQSLPELPHDIGERLRFARQQALAVRKPAISTDVVLSGSSTAALGAGQGQDGFTLWRLLGSLLPLLALLTGLAMIQWWQSEYGISEIAAIDAALLTDDLPPSAYADSGFMQFLKHPTALADQND